MKNFFGYDEDVMKMRKGKSMKKKRQLTEFGKEVKHRLIEMNMT